MSILMCRRTMPEYSSGDGILFTFMGILYAVGFLGAAWILIRRLRKADQAYEDRQAMETQAPENTEILNEIEED